MTLDEIKQALLPCFSGKAFTGPDTLFGSATLKAVFDKSLPDGTLKIDGTLSETANAVIISGNGQGPFAGMPVTANFTPSGANDVAVVVTGTSSGDWSFAGAFPSLAKSPLANLTVLDGATLVLRTLPEGSTPAGLAFSGNVSVAGPVEQIAKLIGSVPSLAFSGAITFSSGAPVFSLTAPVTAPFSLGPLKDLGFNAVLSATSGSASMALQTTVTVTLATGQANLPTSLAFGGSLPLHLVITAPTASGVSLGDLAPFALGGDLQSLMPAKNLFDPTGALTLDTVDFTIDPTVPALKDVTFSLSSTKDWTLDSKLSVGSIEIVLDIDNTSGQPKPSGTLTGTIALGNQGSICTFDVTATIPNATFSGSLDPASNKPNVSSLVTYFLGAVDLPTIELDDLQFSATPSSGSYSINADFASDWSLAIGEHGLAITGATVDLARDSKGLSGSVTGTLELDTVNKFSATYTLPGDFSIVAQIPSIDLGKVIADLCRPLQVSPPGFDFTLTDSTVLLQKSSSDFKFLLGTQLDQYGSAAFVVQDTSGTWGYAFGIDLALGTLDQVPALAPLEAIDAVFGLDELLIIVGTLTETGFSFPALSEFDNPHITGKTISSSGWNKGLVVGLNIYALLDPSKSEVLGALVKLIGFTGTFATTISIPFDPNNGTQLSASVSGSVNSNMPVSGAIVAKLTGGNVSVGLQATIPTSIAGQSVTFTIEGDIEANGVFLSGSTPDSVTFVVVSLGALAIELGVDDEGIPSIGFAGSIKVEDFDSSIAIFLNSSNPAQSLLAGSISDVSLDEVLTPIIGLVAGSVPHEVVDLLKQFQLKGTEQFTIDGSLASALAARNAAPLIKAFADSSAHVTLDPNPRNISILSGGSSTSWALTDLAALAHYHLEKSGNTITVTKEAQVKFVPQATQIGNLPVVPEGYAMSGELEVFGLTGIVDMDIEPKTGLYVEASLSPLHLFNDHLLSVTDDNDASKGPFLSLSSYERNGKPPHATASGKVTLLGLASAGVDINISPSGASFELSSTNPVYQYDLNGTISGLTQMSASGSASVGVDQTLDLGLLGSVPVDIHVGGSISVGLSGSTATAGFSGTFQFEGVGFSVGPLNLDVNTASLANLAETVAEEAADAIKNWLMANLDPTRWLNWVKNNIIPGLINDANKVGQVLGGTFKQGADQIANETNKVLGYGADLTADALAGANVGANAAAEALSKVGFTAQEIAQAIGQAFTNIHADTNLPHIDTPGGVHTDTAHVDTPSVPHVDNAIPPHGDTHVHVDTPSGPHVDGGGGHSDSGSGFFHWDVGVPHVDSTIPPHGDTAPHVDTPSGPHVDSPIAPHVDTGHVDFQVPPHGDTTPHIDVKA